MDRNITFKGPMIRALREGRKIQTRRILDPQPEKIPTGLYHFRYPHGSHSFVSRADLPHYLLDLTRYDTGDRVWVREAYSGPYSLTGIKPANWMPNVPIWYWADGNPPDGDWTKPKPSIHMPRWASRITLTILAMRVERIKAITASDAIAEGITEIGSYADADGDPRIDPLATGWTQRVYGHDPKSIKTEDDLYDAATTPHGAFARLWRSINGPEAWAANPWVAVYTFNVHHCNIDQLEKAA